MKYNGKFDRVKLNQYIREEWSKTPVLKKKNFGYTPKTGKYIFGLTEFEIVNNLWHFYALYFLHFFK